MTNFLLLTCLLAAAVAPPVVQGVKIAFVGDTGMEGTSTRFKFDFIKSKDLTVGDHHCFVRLA
jgi:hypothetical protein